jgi:hypothetical protein
MKTPSRPASVVSAFLVLFGLSCPGPVPAEVPTPPTDLFAEPVELDSSMLLALDMSRIIGTQTELIRHEATEAQRRAALARVNAYVASRPAKKPVLAKNEKARYIAVAVPKSKTTSPKAKTVVMVVKVQAAPKADPKKPAKPPEVNPEKSFVAMANGETYTGTLINNEAYEMPIVPEAGSMQKFDTITAQYVGSGE